MRIAIAIHPLRLMTAHQTPAVMPLSPGAFEPSRFEAKSTTRSSSRTLKERHHDPDLKLSIHRRLLFAHATSQAIRYKSSVTNARHERPCRHRLFTPLELLCLAFCCANQPDRALHLHAQIGDKGLKRLPDRIKCLFRIATVHSAQRS